MMPEQAKYAHKMLVKMTLPVLEKTYADLGVTLKPEDLAPESFYGGVPHPVTGEIIDPEFSIWGMIDDLFSGIKVKKPIAKTPLNGPDKFVVWPKGDGIPTYIHHINGIMWHSDKSINKYNSKSKFVSKGELLSSGKYGLGVSYWIACELWGKDVVDALPIDNL